MKILTLDIETSPIIGYTWGTYDTNVIKVIEPTRMLCFAAKWLGSKKTIYWSEFTDGREAMVSAAHALLDQADVVVHFNGKSFDMKHLNREFVLAGHIPPSPYKQIDLLHVARRNFKFPSNKLQYLSTALGLEGKAQHEGFGLWEKCLKGDPKAWRTMEKYNRQDVVVTENLYLTLLPWIPSHPNRRLHDGIDGCPTCGSKHLQRRGTAYTAASAFQRWQCQGCGVYFRSTKRLHGTDLAQVAS